MRNLIGKKMLFIDGGLGTMIGKTDVLPEILNIKEPERIKKIHTAYLQSGADIITSNTFGANRFKLQNYSVSEIVEAAMRNARECAEKFGRGFVTLDVGPLGALLKPMGTVDFEDAYSAFAETVTAGQKYADMISLETFTDIYELKAAVLAAKECSSLPVLASVSLDKDGKMLCGADIMSVVAMLEGLRVDVIGLNCGFGPDKYKPIFEKLQKISSTPIAIVPNAGLPRFVNGETVFDLDAEAFSNIMREFAEKGAQLLGGCCGTTPEHIRLTREKCSGVKMKLPENKNITFVSSFGAGVEIGKRPIVIGERINPTGKKKLKEALRNNDIEYILKEGISQQENGADVLDVNVGLPEIDETAMMKKAVFELQSILSIPLQIDSSSPEALEAAMRIYNGKPMINSVNGKKESMDAVFPLVQKYGGVLVGLTLDEDGIPEKAEGRFKIAEKIINEAAKYGIDKKDIIIDPLTLTVSSEPSAPRETLRAVNMIHEKLHAHTVLGVSNVSFGLPERPTANTAFLTMAMHSGLSAAIMNPLSSQMMGAVAAFNALMGFDEDCRNYIERFSETEKNEKAAFTELSLRDIIELGLKSAAYDKTLEMLKNTDGLEIINEHIIPALDAVGKGFEEKKIYLPSLLSSAETAKNAFAAISDSSKETKSGEDKILLATVHGDIHDIGKNIVKLLLQNYGFDVVDLGKDVESEKIVECAVRENIHLIGLSALMTTTVSSMEETIKALRETGKDFKIVVGGAVLTREYADMIGADCYAPDALATVNYAKKIFGRN